jgi:hypothetical protein
MRMRFIGLRLPSKLLVPTALLVAVCCARPPVARAQEPASPSEQSGEPSREPGALSYSGSAGALYGGLPGASDSVNPFGVGLGLRLGVTLPGRLYFGLSYEHFFGGPPSRFSNIAAYETEATLDDLQAWVGYQLPLDGVTLRPCLGIGAGYKQEETLTTDARGQERSEENALGVVASGALQLIFPVGPASMLIEGRYSMVPEALAEADGLLVGVGFGAEL